jgi:hypothetical protein
LQQRGAYGRKEDGFLHGSFPVSRMALMKNGILRSRDGRFKHAAIQSVSKSCRRSGLKHTL